VLPTLAELGIGFVPFSPLGRGFLTGTIDTAAAFGRGDVRRSLPRFTEDALVANASVLTAVRSIAAEKACMPGQVALAWLLAQQPWIVPIPGTRSPERLAENVAAVDVVLDADDLRRLSTADEGVQGERYTPEMARHINR
jgi:aryl-alcohol dehydrogenase-like predicted oxidoreductase